MFTRQFHGVILILLQLCPRYCLVCHDRLQTDYVALKPYVCNSPLCTYQYYHLNWGPSLEVRRYVAPSNNHMAEN